VVTNLHGHHGPAVSEAVLTSMLALARDLRRSLAHQAAARWQRFPATLLAGKTVGIVGVGAIAEALALRCTSLEMQVVGVSSTPRPVANFARIHAREELEQVAAEVDFLVLLTPYTPATRGIVSGAVLAAIPHQRRARWRHRRAGAGQGPAATQDRRGGPGCLQPGAAA